ncbi:AAA family ATPase [Aureimonas psammosilenae]|uniref:AAA family ATPase n=1 Tax=Aureimonas psammosilenae TaxID=2495496 RepID=UPI00126108A2|nr:AAA family ATPase [Aureimonas psammosilenae]
MAGAIMPDTFSFHEAEWRDCEANVADVAKSYARELKAFDKLEDQIRTGAHCPSVSQLLDGHSPLKDSLAFDIEVWVARSRFVAAVPESLREDLKAFGVWPSLSGAIRIHDAAATLDLATDAVEIAYVRERAAWYAAVFGDRRLRDMLFNMHGSIDHRRLCYRFGLEFQLDFPTQADEWKSGWQTAVAADGHLILRRFAALTEAHDWLREHHASVMRFTNGKLQRSELFALANPVAAAGRETLENDAAARQARAEQLAAEGETGVDESGNVTDLDVHLAAEALGTKTISDLLGQPKLAVIPKIEVTGTSEQKTFLGQFAKLSLLRVPLVVAPDVAAIARDLVRVWPHAGNVVRRILADVVPGQPVRLRPTLLVGDPGSGKTRLLAALTRRLGLPAVVFPCASVADGSFGGTPAQWSTRRASVPLELIRSNKIANPAVILDELEKTGTSSHNGSLLHALLPMLERHSAEAYFETALETNVNLSGVSFLATANDVKSIPDPLRDRFRVVVMPNPGLEHLDALIDGIAIDVHEERGIPLRFFEGLAPDEVEIVGKAWGGGSLRKLRAAVEATLDHRDRSRTMQ